MAIEIKLGNQLDIEIKTKMNVPVDFEEGNAKEDEVVRGKTFFAGNKLLKTGTLDAFKVQQSLLSEDNCRLEITTLGKPDTEEEITNRNISLYKMQDQQRIIREGGEFASDEEYVESEKYLQELYKIIMGVEEDG